MGQFLGSFLDNDSPFGQIMTRCGIIIGANLMFVLFSMPLVTAGPALAALYYVMLSVLHGDGGLNPFTTFWKGFRTNLKQGILSWLGILLLAAILSMDISICRQAGGVMRIFLYASCALAVFFLILAIYLYPVMSVFSDTLPHLVRNALFFASRKPWKAILLTVVHILPILITVLDERMRPLYGFLWITCGFGALVLLCSSFLIREFEEFLPKPVADPEKTEEGREGAAAMTGAGRPISPREQRKRDKEILEEMKKLQ